MFKFIKLASSMLIKKTQLMHKKGETIKERLLNVLSQTSNTTFDFPICDNFDSPAELKAFFSNAMQKINPDLPPGLAGDICNDIAFFEKRHLVPTRPIAALAVIARLSAHRKILGNQKVSFLALVSAESAMGKEAQQEFQKLLLNAVGLTDSVVGEPRSDRQMMEALADYEHLIYILDEVHGMFDKTRAKSASAHEKAMLNMILTLSCTSLYQFPPKIKKDLISQVEKDLEGLTRRPSTDENCVLIKKKERVLKNLRDGWKDPFLAFVGYSTPCNLDSLINEQNIQSGLIGRFVFVRVFDRDYLNPNEYSNGPSRELIARCGLLLKKEGEIRITEEAKVLLKHIISYYELNEHRNHPKLGAIYARGVEHVKRIASLLAMETSLVTSEMLLYAMRLFLVNIESCTEIINGATTTVQQEITRLHELILKKLRRGPIKAGTFANYIGKCSAYLREKGKEESGYVYTFLNDMVERGMICFSETDKHYSLPPDN